MHNMCICKTVHGSECVFVQKCTRMNVHLCMSVNMFVQERECAFAQKCTRMNMHLCMIRNVCYWFEGGEIKMPFHLMRQT